MVIEFSTVHASLKIEFHFVYVAEKNENEIINETSNKIVMCLWLLVPWPELVQTFYTTKVLALALKLKLNTFAHKSPWQ